MYQPCEIAWRMSCPWLDICICVIDRSPDKAAALTAEGLTLHALLTRAQLDEAEARRTP